MKRKRQPLMIVLAGFLLGLWLPGCGRGDQVGQAIAPVANITSPASGSSLNQGQEILITFNAADINGIAQVELLIDGQPALVESVEPPVNSYTASHRWAAQTPGNHVIELRAFNVNSEPSEPSRIFITVVAVDSPAGPSPTPAPAADTPTPVAIPTDTPSPQPPTPTSPAPTATPAAATTTEPSVTAVVGLNVRSGPGTNYPVIGRLAQGQTARITGRDSLSAWWQIDYNSQQGWVSGGSEYSTATNTAAVPVVQAPPLPSVPTPTQIPPTPGSLKPTIHSFTANRYTIARGESVTLNWDLSNAAAAVLRYDDREEGVTAPGSKTVAPVEDTDYTLVARNDAGETLAKLTIEVTGSAPTPVPVLRDGKIRIANGQSVDFDQGIVQSGSNDDADFLWDGQRQQFFPQNGAAGALLGKPYSAITLDNCLDAAYNKPISGVDGSTQVTGCYITDRGRYGKFFVSEWDIAANLTVEWLTWNYAP
jgi:hypothetical protein